MSTQGARLRRVAYAELAGILAEREAVDAGAMADAGRIVAEVRSDGDAALHRYGTRFGELARDSPLLLGRDHLARALDAIAGDERALLERVAERVRSFASAQLACLLPLDTTVEGGRAGHDIAPVSSAGCYAPGGGYPLPSSVLMTAVTARAAGVERVIVASPRPTPITLAAAAIAGADALVPLGGAHAIAALAYGTATVPAVDVIVGPGNRWVTAAKKLVHGRVGIDMLAGPSELVVLADASADPAVIAADLLAQAEHAADALPVVVSTDSALLDQVDHALAVQLADLPTRAIAAEAVSGGLSVQCASLDQAVAACDAIAPEHLELMLAYPHAVKPRLHHYGALFIGAGAAEVLGDYGAGPNHVLPTGGTARYQGGLSVLSFLRLRTWLDLAVPALLAQDAAALARLEGLEAHARSALRRS